MPEKNSFGSLAKLRVGDSELDYYRIDAVEGAQRLPFSLRGGWLEQAGDGAHAAAHICDPSLGERGGRAHHPGLARPRQPRKHGALHPGRHQNDQQHAEST